MLLSTTRTQIDRIASLAFAGEKRQYRSVDYDHNFEIIHTDILGSQGDSSIPGLIFLRFNSDENHARLIIMIDSNQALRNNFDRQGREFDVYGYGFPKSQGDLSQEYVKAIEDQFTGDDMYGFQGYDPDFSFTNADKIRAEQNKYLLIYGADTLKKSRPIQKTSGKSDDSEIEKTSDDVFADWVDERERFHQQLDDVSDQAVNQTLENVIDWLAQEVVQQYYLDNLEQQQRLAAEAEIKQQSQVVELLQEEMQPLEAETATDSVELEKECQQTIDRHLDFSAGMIELSMRLVGLIEELNIDLEEESLIPESVISGLGSYNSQALTALEVLLGLKDNSNRADRIHPYSYEDVVDSIEMRTKKTLRDTLRYNSDLLNSILESYHSKSLVKQWRSYLQDRIAVMLYEVLQELFNQDSCLSSLELMPKPVDEFALDSSLIDMIDGIQLLCDQLIRDHSGHSDEYDDYLSILDTISQYLSQMSYVSELTKWVISDVNFYKQYPKVPKDRFPNAVVSSVQRVQLLHRIIVDLELLGADHLRFGQLLGFKREREARRLVAQYESHFPHDLLYEKTVYRMFKQVFRHFMRWQSPLQKYTELIERAQIHVQQLQQEKVMVASEQYQGQLVVAKKGAGFIDLQLLAYSQVDHSVIKLLTAAGSPQSIGDDSKCIGIYIIRFNGAAHDLPTPTIYLVAEKNDTKKFQAYMFGMPADLPTKELEVFLKKQNVDNELIFSQAFLLAKEQYSAEQLEQRLVDLYCNSKLPFNAGTVDLVVGGIKSAWDCDARMQLQHDLSCAKERIEQLTTEVDSQTQITLKQRIAELQGELARLKRHSRMAVEEAGIEAKLELTTKRKSQLIAMQDSLGALERSLGGVGEDAQQQLLEAKQQIAKLTDENDELTTMLEINKGMMQRSYETELKNQKLVSDNDKLQQKLSEMQQQLVVNQSGTAPESSLAGEIVAAAREEIGIQTVAVLALNQLVSVASQLVHSYDLLQAQYLQQANEKLSQLDSQVSVAPAQQGFLQRILNRSAVNHHAISGEADKVKALMAEFGRVGLSQSEAFALCLQQLSGLMMSLTSSQSLAEKDIASVKKSLGELLQHAIANLMKLVAELLPDINNYHQQIKRTLFAKMLAKVDSVLGVTFEKLLPKMESQFELSQLSLEPVIIEQVTLLSKLIQEHAKLKVDARSVGQLTEVLHEQLQAIVAVQNCVDGKFEQISDQCLIEFAAKLVAMEKAIKADKSKRLSPIKGDSGGVTTTVSGANGALGMSSFGRQLSSCEQTIVVYTDHIAQACTLLLQWYQQVCILEGCELAADALQQSEALINHFVAYCTTQLAAIHGKYYIDMNPAAITTSAGHTELAKRNQEAKDSAVKEYVTFVEQVMEQITSTVKAGIESSSVVIFPQGFGSVTQTERGLWEACVAQRQGALAEGLIGAKQEVAEQQEQQAAALKDQQVNAAVMIQSLFRGYRVRKHQQSKGEDSAARVEQDGILPQKMA